MTDWKSIALDATDELRRQLCRHGPHEMVPEQMMKCPRCGPIVRLERMVEEEKRAESSR